MINLIILLDQKWKEEKAITNENVSKLQKVKERQKVFWKKTKKKLLKVRYFQ